MTRDTTADVLLDVFRRILDRPDLTAGGNLFEFGCTSMLCLKATLTAIDAGLPVTVFDVYRHRTIDGIARAAAARALRGGEEAAADPAPDPAPDPAGDTPAPTLTPTARFLVERDHGRAGFGEHYNISILWAVEPGQVDERLLREAVKTLIDRNPALRGRLHRSAVGLEKTFADGAAPDDTLETIDLSPLPREAQPGEVERLCAQAQHAFRFGEDRPLIRFVLFRLSDGRARLLVTAHHLLLDGVAFALMFKELGRLYRGLSQRVATRSLVAATEPSAWPRRLHRYANREAVAELPYWRAIPWDRYRSVALLPAGDAPEAPGPGATFAEETARALHHALQARDAAGPPEALERDQAIIRLRLDDRASDAFLSMPGDQGYDVALLAIHRAVRETTTLEELWIDSFQSCRGRVFDDVDHSRTLGYVNEICPLLLAMVPDGSPRDQIAAVRAQREAMPRLGLGLRALKYFCDDEEVRREAAAWPFPRIGLNYIVTLRRSHPETFLDLARAPEWFGVEIDESRTPYLMCFILSCEKGGVVLDTRYDPTAAGHAAVRRAASRVVAEIAAILDGLDA